MTASSRRRKGDVPLYLYALVEGLRSPPRSRPVTRGALKIVRAGGFSVLVGVLDDEATIPSELGALQRHDRVVRAAHAKAKALLPIRFGTTVESPRELASVLRARAKPLRQALKAVRGREQLTLRLVGPEGGGPSQPAAGGPSTGGLMSALAAAFGFGRTAPSPSTSASAAASKRSRGARPKKDQKRAGAAYLRERAALEKQRREVPELEPVRALVEPWIRAERAERSQGPGTVRATVFHLVDRGKARAYLRRVKSAPQLPGEWRLIVSGPAPAWGFGPEALR